MKINTFLIILSLAITSSCTSIKNNNIESRKDPIVGTWKFKKTIKVDENGDMFYSTLTKCGKQTRHKYFADGTIIFQMGTSDKNDKCIVLPNKFYTGTWKKDRKGNYIMHYKMSPENGKVREFTMRTVKYGFSDDESVMVKTYYYKDEGIVFGEPVLIIGEISTFERVKD